MVVCPPRKLTSSTSAITYNSVSNTSLLVSICTLQVLQVCCCLQATPAPVFPKFSFDLSVQNKTFLSLSLCYLASLAIVLASRGSVRTLPGNPSRSTRSVHSVLMSVLIAVPSATTPSSYCLSIPGLLLSGCASASSFTVCSPGCVYSLSSLSEVCRISWAGCITGAARSRYLYLYSRLFRRDSAGGRLASLMTTPFDAERTILVTVIPYLLMCLWYSSHQPF